MKNNYCLLDVTLYSLMNVYRRFRRTYSPNHQGRCNWCYHL